MLFILALSFVAVLIELKAEIYFTLVSAFVICIVLLFATEIKRSVWNVKINKHQGRDVSNVVKSSAKAVTICINEIIKAKVGGVSHERL